jgi:hypothetical protein
VATTQLRVLAAAPAAVQDTPSSLTPPCPLNKPQRNRPNRPTNPGPQVLDAPEAYQSELQSELRRFPGITGVPHFIISTDGTGVMTQPVARLGGAQPPEEFEEAFDVIVGLAAAKGKGGAGAGAAGAAGSRAAARADERHI